MPKVILHSDRFSYRHAPVTPVLLVSLVTMFLPKAWLHFLHIDTQPTIPPLAPTPLISYHLYNFPPLYSYYTNLYLPHQTTLDYTYYPKLHLLHQSTPSYSQFSKLWLHQITSTKPNYTYYANLYPPHQTATITPNHTYFTKLQLSHQTQPN